MESEGRNGERKDERKCVRQQRESDEGDAELKEREGLNKGAREKARGKGRKICAKKEGGCGRSRRIGETNTQG